MDNLKERVEQVLAEIRPYLESEGGGVEFVEITSEGVVKLRLVGACGLCPMSTYTLKMAIEQKLKEVIPEIKGVEQVITKPGGSKG